MVLKGQFSGEKHPMYGKKHTKEAIQKMSLAQKKNPTRYWLGKKRSEETKKKVSLAQTGKKRSKESIEKRRAKVMGHLTSPETRKKISLAQKGKPRPYTTGNKNGSWKGGVNPIYHTIRNCLAYVNWRLAVFGRDNYACQLCGDNKGRNLEAHHKKEFSIILKENFIKTLEQALTCDLLWDIENGITLCDVCHRKLHHG